MDTTNLEKSIAGLVAATSDEAIHKLRKVLFSHTSDAVPTVNMLLHETRTEQINPHLLGILVNAWREEKFGISAQSVALALGAAIQISKIFTAEQLKPELVWTGPYPPSGKNVRKTLSVMLEMIENARDHILLVGYHLSAGSELVESIIKALSKAKLRGCGIVVALHNDGHNHNLFRDLWPPDICLPRILFWKAGGSDQFASLHAKLLAVDGIDLLVTSANLTHHGLETNIEVGIRVECPLARNIISHFTALEHDGLLVEAE